jgi:hypothetical protein
MTQGRRGIGVFLVCTTSLVLVGCAGRPSADKGVVAPKNDAVIGAPVTTSAAVGVDALPARCRSSRVEVIFDYAQGAGGTEYGFFLIRNVTSESCSLYGRPQITLLDRHGAPVETEVMAGPPSPSQHDRDSVPEPVILRPGAQGGFDLLWVFPAPRGRCTGPVVVPEQLEIRLPGTGDRTVLSAYPVHGIHGIDTCKDEISVTPIYGPPRG